MSDYPQEAMPPLILVTGIMAAGKSTVAQALAERLARSVHLRGDEFRRMIVNGQAEMGLELSAEGRSQLLLRYRIAAAAAKLYLEAGFAVVYQDIIIGKDLPDVVRMFAGYRPHVVILSPDAATVARREAERPKSGYGPAIDVDSFDRAFRDETPSLGIMLDTSGLSVEETVDRILGNLEDARVEVVIGA